MAKVVAPDPTQQIELPAVVGIGVEPVPAAGAGVGVAVAAAVGAAVVEVWPDTAEIRMTKTERTWKSQSAQISNNQEIIFDFRNFGIGAQTLTWVITRVRSFELKRTYLLVVDKNKRS